jgi:hypothetical protein
VVRVRILMYSERLITETEKKREQMSIVTLVVDITYPNGETLRPIYECHGEEGFAKFAAWHNEHLSVGTTAILNGYGLNNPEPLMTVAIAK